ncbi:cyclic nucleotide-binding domain-containing protein [Legionella sp.]|uniref:cyclic nucleotide-binding domain-containing protein n=1 Tax=Legionella sp. TaxID=459 RepID=UPI0032208870
MDDKDKTNFYLVSVVLITAVGMSILLSSYSTALYLGNFSRSTLPYYFIVSGLLSALIVGGLVRFLSSANKAPILIIQVSSMVLVLVYLIFNLWPSKLLALIYTFLFITLLTIYNATSWNIAAASFELRVFKSFANRFLVLISVSSILISILAYIGIDILGQEFLIYFALLLMAVNCIAVKKIQPQQTHFKEPTDKSISLKTYPLFVSVASFLALINIISVFANYQMLFRLSQTLDTTQVTKFMTVFYLFMEGGSFLIQLYGKRILESFGISALFLLSTGVILISFIPSIFYPYLYTITFFNLIILIFYTSLISFGWQVALNALPFSLKKRGQIFIQAVTNNMAKIAASFILLIFAYRYAFYSYQILTGLFLAFMLILSWKIKQFYGETLLSNIKEKRFYLPIFNEENDYHFLANQVKNLLSSKDPIKIKVGLSILRWANPNQVTQELITLFDYPDPSVRIKAYKTSRYFGKLPIDNKIMQQLQKETDQEATWQLLYLIFRKYQERIIEKLDEYLHSSNPPYQAIAIITAINYGELHHVSHAIKVLDTMANSPNEDARFFAVMALNHIDIGNPVELIKKLTNDPSYKVAKQAIKATHHTKDKRIVRLLIAQLDKPRVSYDAMQSLIKIKIDVAPLILRTCLTVNVHRYKPLIRVLCRLNTTTTERCLGRLITRAPFLFSVELSKQIALRATRFPLSSQLKCNISSHLNCVVNELNIFNFLFKKENNLAKKHELMLRKQLIEKKLICYLATLIQPKSIMEILPKLSSKQELQHSNSEHDIALEYLDWLIEDRGLAKKVFAAIEDKLRMNDLDISQFELDCWSKKMLYHQASEDNTMDTVDKVFALRKVPIYSHVPAELLISVAEECHLVEFPKGKKLIEIGDYPDKIYMILSGSATILYHGKIERYAKENDLIGLFIILSEHNSPLEVIVNEDSTMLELSRNVFEQLTNDYPDILKEIAKYIVNIYFNVVEKNIQTDSTVLSKVL